MYNVTCLENGLRVASAFMPRIESEALGIWAKVGGRYENLSNSGISHFIEHLLFKGTKTRSSLKIKEEIEGRGGSLNGFTAEEFTCFYAKVLKEKAETGLEVLADMVLNARLAELDIQKERLVVIEEIKMYWDQPASYVLDLVNELLWPKHPLGMHLAGTPETIRRLTLEEIRNFKENFYFPRNMLVSAAGPLPHDELVKTCRQLFRIKKRQIPKNFKIFSSRSKKPSSYFKEKTTEQTHLCIGFRTLGRRHPDRYPLALLNVILGGNMSSRLFQVVRETKGLAYDIGSHVKQYHDTGAFIVSAGVENEKITKTIEVILQELQRITKKNSSSNELERAKEFYRGQLLLGLEDTSEQMMWLGENILTVNKPVDVKEVLEKIELVTAGDIRRVAGNVFKRGNLHLAMIGPITQSQQLQIQREVNHS